VEEGEAPKVVEAILAANQTGNIGDGRIFLCPLLNAVRIRTREQGAAALGVQDSEVEVAT
ncbi:MAG TPA: P-II family nitrogen regulator, partial [Firmicutes bacterium]|nr:P-II family nitrogen regulator [Bacillota bacterium]